MTTTTELLDFRPASLPAHADRLLAATLAGVAGAMTAGLALGLAGAYEPPLAMGTGLVVAVVTHLLWRGAPDSSRAMPAWWVLITAGLILGITALHVAHSGEHLVVDRDPGVYATTGLWLVENDSPVIETQFAEFGEPDAIRPTSLAYPSQDGGETLMPQFPHGFPVVLSFAGWIGGDGALFIINPLLIALALMSVFAIGARLAGPLAGASAALALGLNPVQAFFGRDTYSEILAQALIWGGLWMAVRAWRSPTMAPPLIAGLIIGSAMMARLDAAILFVPLAVGLTAILAAERYRREPEFAQSAENTLWIALGAVVAGMFAVIETKLASLSYYWSLESRLIDLAQLTMAIAVVGALAIVALPRSAPAFQRLVGRLRAPAAAAAGLVILVAGLVAWFVRPRVQVDRGPADAPNGLIGFLQRRAGVPEDPIRTYFEETMVWLQWYLGAPTLALGLIGIAAASAWVVWRGFPPAATLATAMVVMASALYLRDPQITPDQIWATRRFLPMIIPGVFLAAAALAAALAAWSGRGSRVARLAGIAALIGVPLWQGLDVRDETIREHHGSLAGVRAICTAVGPDAGIVLAQPAMNLPTYPENIHLGFAPALRGVCDQPTVATNEPLAPERALAIAAALRDAGRRLVVVSPVDRPFAFAPRPAGTDRASDFTYRRLRLQVESRPHAPAGRRVRAWATPIDPDQGLALAFGRGFHAPEPSRTGDNRWIRAREARIAVVVGSAGEVDITVPMRSLVAAGDVEVLLDGRSIGRVRVGADRLRPYTVSARVAAGRHTITLVPELGPRRVSDVLGTDDDRRVSVMVGEPIAITPAAGEANAP